MRLLLVIWLFVTLSISHSIFEVVDDHTVKIDLRLSDGYVCAYSINRDGTGYTQWRCSSFFKYMIVFKKEKNVNN